jgi:hypothetical protein
MLVQTRQDGLRLIRQNDHALVSARLALEWVGFGRVPRPLPFPLVLAVGLHDIAWASADAAPERDPATGRPRAFDTVDDAYRVPLYSDGLDQLEAIDDFSGLLGSHHYGRFLPADSPFGRREAERRARIEARLDPSLTDPAALDIRRAYVRHFDFLSLFVCLTDPGAVNPPEWLSPESIGEAPDGTRYALSWAADDVIRCDPFPFAAPFRVAFPARDLPRVTYATDQELQDAWTAAPPRVVRVRLEGPAAGQV